jgi:hypothetical protein
MAFLHSQDQKPPLRRCRCCACVSLYVAGVCLNRMGTV